MNKTRYLSNLNGLRFLAASYTIFFHYWSFPGFVLSYSYSQYDFSHPGKIKTYLIKRLIRIAPIYYMAMFLAIPLLIRKQMISPSSIIENISYFISHLFMVQALIPFKELISYWNVHSWSLSVEIFLYLLSPWIIFSSRKLKDQSLYFLSIIMFIFSAMIFFIAHPSQSPELVSKFFAPLHLPNFINGVLWAQIYIRKKESINSYTPLLFITSSFSFFFLILMNYSDWFYSAYNPLFQMTFILMILGSCQKNWTNSFLGTKTMITLGDISYALYILQAPIKTYTQQILFKVIGYQQHNGLIFNIVIYIAILSSAYIVSLKFDSKIRKRLNQFFFKIDPKARS